MSCIHITACQLASLASALPAQSSQRIKGSTYPCINLEIKFPKLSLNLTSAASRYQRAGAVCLFGGKGKPENGNEGSPSPWTALENAVSSFKKDNSIEDVLRQQIQKQEYYDDGGTGGKPPRGGDGGGGGGFGEAEDEGFPGALDEFAQTMLATTGFIFLYIYIIGGEEIAVVIRDSLRFIFTRQKSNRLRRLIDQWNSFFERMKEKEEFDPYRLERGILNTPTWFDSPAKYWYIINALDSISDDDDDDDEANDDDEE